MQRTQPIVLTVLAVGAFMLPGCSNSAAPAQAPVGNTVRVDASATTGMVPQTAFGLNTAVWDGQLLDPAIPDKLKSIGVSALRFPGGSTSDVYHWKTHSLTPNCGYANPADTFDAFMNIALKTGATPIITVNYGTNADGTGGGDPAEAADWVRYANKTNHYNITYWEIGNEVYGNGFYGADWEKDYHVPDSAGQAARKGNSALGPVAYGTAAAAYIRAMKAVDPTIKVGVVLTAPGAWPDGADPDWNTNVLAQCGSLIDFADIHLYPQQPGQESDSGLLASTKTIPDTVASLRKVIEHGCGANASNVSIFLTETNSVAYNPGKQTVGIVNALFLADDFMSWIEAGAANVDWWNLHNGASSGNNNSAALHGSADFGDYGLLSSGQPGPAPETAYPTYFGMQMLGHLASPGDLMVRSGSADPMVAVHAIFHPNDSLRILLINKDPDHPHTVILSVDGFKPAADGTAYTYGDGDSGLRKKTMSASPAMDVTLAPYSMQALVLTAAK